MFDRVALARTRAPPDLQSRSFNAPRRGWIRNESIARPTPDGAEVLENIFPTPEGGRIRKGRAQHATVPSQPTHFAVYETGSANDFFAFDADSIFEISSPASATVAPTPAIQQLTGSAWSSVLMTTTGGDFLMAANGADPIHVYDGTNWFPLNTAATSGLAYDAGPGDFTVGDTVTGGTSGATATIVGVLNGTTAVGTLLVQGITGTFADNEALTDGSGGAATSNIPSGVTSINTAVTSGLATSSVSYLWKHKSRVWAVEADSTSAWYLPADAIAGAFTEFPLGGVLAQGGTLLFGGTWSQDSGAGRDDLMIFISTTGEVAVYEGTDPSSNFSLVGVYRIGRPLGKNAHFRAGGDLAILTDDGIVPLAGAVQADRAALSGKAVTYPIEEEWRQIVKSRVNATDSYSATLWHRETMLVVGVPSLLGVPGYVLIANARTGGWTKYTGWDVRASAVFDDKLYFGDGDGAIWRGETTGADDGDAYAPLWVPRFDMLGDPGHKVAMHCRLLARTNKSWRVQLFACGDYFVRPPTPLEAPDNDGVSLWDTGTWDSAVWDEGATPYKNTLTEWQSVAAHGAALAPGVMIPSGRSQEPDLEFISLTLAYQRASLIG